MSKPSFAIVAAMMMLIVTGWAGAAEASKFKIRNCGNHMATVDIAIVQAGYPSTKGMGKNEQITLRCAGNKCNLTFHSLDKIKTYADKKAGEYVFLIKSNEDKNDNLPGEGVSFKLKEGDDCSVFD